jgi:uncharacterized protein (TIGR02466 family)
MASGVLSLFPTIVWRVELARALHERIDGALMALLQEPIAKVGARQSWQSQHALHEEPSLAELVAAIEKLVRGALGFLHIGHDDFTITGCWANVNGPGAAHALHHHPNNYFSGVYYARVAEGGDTICFHDPRVQTRAIRPPVTSLTNENTDLAVAKVEPGTLLLFPAWLEHSVPPNESREQRVSVSFNVMFDKYVESMSAPMWLPGYR